MYRWARWIWGQVAALILLVLLSACGGGTPDDRVTVEEAKEVQGQAVTEMFRVDNAKGTVPLTQDMQAKKQYTHEVVIKMNAGVRANTSQVRQEVLKLYNIGESDLNKDQICIVPVDVPAEQVYLYEVEWREVWREGTIEIGEPDGKQEGTYRFKQGPLCQITGVRPESQP